MAIYALGLHEIDRTKLGLAGGKGANLGELSRIDAIRVPDGFCVTTDAYADAVEKNEEFSSLLDQLSLLQAEDEERIQDVCARIRNVVEGIPFPAVIAGEISRHLERLGAEDAYAVRSSATAEDLPTASFAGQQDTYLNIVGTGAVLRHVSKCWASLFTDRAVAYRIRNGFDHHKVQLAVVVQRMVFSRAAGIMFTADPITSNRKVTSIDAGFGLGEALVSGLANADHYKVQDRRIVDKKVSTQELAVYAATAGGTETKKVAAEHRHIQALTDQQILQLERMGRTIEVHFGRPQDIEWCLSDDTFLIVQSRAITTLFPIPGPQDGKNHVYMSFSHQQMMTDAMKPLGSSFFQLGFEETPLIQAGGRFYADLSYDLTSPVGRRVVLASMKRIDPLMLKPIKTLMKREGFMKGLARGGQRYFRMGAGYFSWALPVEAVKIYRKNDAASVHALMSRDAVAIRDARQRIARLSGDALFAFIVDDVKQLKEELYSPQRMGMVYVGLYALNWINKHMEKWLGEKSVADTLSQSVAHNVTSEMGMELLDVADVVRQHPPVLEHLQQVDSESFLPDLDRLEGGDAVHRSIEAYLEKYGMRCPGEIDITRPRWSERPADLVPIILGNIKNFEPNAHETLFERRRREAKEKEQDLLDRLERLPGGRRKAKKARRVISVLRNFVGYREYPKYFMMQRYWIIKQAMLREAATLVQEGVIREKEDIYYLSFEEFWQAVRTNQQDYGVIAKRKEEHDVFEKLTPPRVVTSEGEIISGEYETGTLPTAALAGIPASSGTIEGRARIVARMEDAEFEEGDVLVTKFTDPSWTPLFLSAKGLVTEVGGMMTHGAVVAREYGLPAVVGVEGATRLIEDGQRVRVNGTEGYVEILDSADGK
jgi:phosphoenolpyruvate synthase/pyruvate phosphate dikinase